MATEPKPRAIEVRKAEFDRDPARFIRRATSDQQVIVRHETGRVSAVFGGSLDVSPDGGPSPREA